MNSRQIIKLLKQDGWYQVATTESHHHFKHPVKNFKHPVKKGKVTVPHPKKIFRSKR